jgi:hypothetical protein
MFFSKINNYIKETTLIIGLALGICSLGFISGCKEEPKQGAERQERPPIEVKAGVDKAVATIGDIITYTLSVDSLPEVETQIPEFGAEIAGFRIVDRGTEGPKELEGRVLTKKWYELRADIVGSYIIPPVKLTYKLAAEREPKEVQTAQIFVEVKSAIPEGEEQKDIIDIKPLELPKVDYVLWAAIISDAVVMVLLIIWGIRYYQKRKGSGEIVVKPPAHEVALSELKRLKAVTCTDEQAIKKLYFDLSEIFRCYLEERYGFPATDWTSEEIVSQINQNRELPFELKQQSKSFLSNTDMVKFAEYIPEARQIQEELERAIGFVEATKEVIVEEIQPDAV